jgi:hypothetical protein
VFGCGSLPVLSAPTSNRDKMHRVTRLSHWPSHSARTWPPLPCPDALRELWCCFRERFHGASPDLLHPVTTRPRPGFQGVFLSFSPSPIFDHRSVQGSAIGLP